MPVRVIVVAQQVSMHAVYRRKVSYLIALRSTDAYRKFFLRKTQVKNVCDTGFKKFKFYFRAK